MLSGAVSGVRGASLVEVERECVWSECCEKHSAAADAGVGIKLDARYDGSDCLRAAYVGSSMSAECRSGMSGVSGDRRNALGLLKNPASPRCSGGGRGRGARANGGPMICVWSDDGDMDPVMTSPNE